MLKKYWQDKQLHKDTFAVALPMILSNLTVPLTGLVDTAVVGHLEHPYFLGATAVGALIITMLAWLMGFLRMGTTGLVAQAYGASEDQAIWRVLVNAGLLATVLASILVLTQTLIWNSAIYFIESSDALLGAAKSYFDIRIWSMPAMLLRYVLIGWLLGMQNARLPLIILIVTNIVNIVLDIVFVVYLEFGIAGAAWASFIADYVGVVVALLGVWIILSRHKISQSWHQLVSKKDWRTLMYVNRDIFIRNLALQLVFFIQTSIGARLGDLILAANAILMNFVLLASYGLDGFAHAVEALSGKALGRKDRYLFMGSFVISGFWSVFISICFCLIFWIAGESIVNLMTDIDDVRKITKEYLIYLVFIPIVSVFSYWLDGVFVGTTRSAEMRNSMVFSVFFVFVPMTFTTYWLGNHGLWIAFHLLMVARAAGLIYYFIQLDKKQQFC